MKSSPLILEIKGNALDDGPGIRTVVFFKGCPLNCVWCHNPESKKRGVELSFDANGCIECNHCINACAAGSLSRDNPFFIDRDNCTLCFECVEACPSGSMSRVGAPMTIDQIVEKVTKDKAFFDTSGGGVTLSGGEPTLDIPFTSKLMKELKKKGVHILIETCGFFNFDSFKDLIYPHVDMIYCDIKLMDPEEHKTFCGVSNDQILRNFIMLNKEYSKGGVEIIPRTPLVPDITDTEYNISAIANFYRENGVKKAALLSYNPLWHEKNKKVGVKNPYSEIKKMSHWISREKEDACRTIFKNAGIEVV
ncbi:glycyl-radical enzyme activating protein [Desulfoluna sp.]|uniref:glycyl-radical enzyme activating protein n=1 Tax=Desulfoluna sp. TaxID=2045199 RepID=UPI00261B75F9|nr:glycyl-radical enzyme activating protein [Desulfoluna sp.]